MKPMSYFALIIHHINPVILNINIIGIYNVSPVLQMNIKYKCIVQCITIYLEFSSSHILFKWTDDYLCNGLSIGSCPTFDESMHVWCSMVLNGAQWCSMVGSISSVYVIFLLYSFTLYLIVTQFIMILLYKCNIINVVHHV